MSYLISKTRQYVEGILDHKMLYEESRLISTSKAPFNELFKTLKRDGHDITILVENGFHKEVKVEGESLVTLNDVPVNVVVANGRATVIMRDYTIRVLSRHLMDSILCTTNFGMNNKRYHPLHISTVFSRFYSELMKSLPLIFNNHWIVSYQGVKYLDIIYLSRNQLKVVEDVRGMTAISDVEEGIDISELLDLCVSPSLLTKFLKAHRFTPLNIIVARCKMNLINFPFNDGVESQKRDHCLCCSVNTGADKTYACLTCYERHLNEIKVQDYRTFAEKCGNRVVYGGMCFHDDESFAEYKSLVNCVEQVNGDLKRVLNLCLTAMIASITDSMSDFDLSSEYYGEKMMLVGKNCIRVIKTFLRLGVAFPFHMGKIMQFQIHVHSPTNQFLIGKD
jgi:hypothetical protein